MTILFLTLFLVVALIFFSSSSLDGNKRKSKWDIGINQMPAAALKPATLITPTVLPVPTGTKPTVISAFGTISKKAKQ